MVNTGPTPSGSPLLDRDREVATVRRLLDAARDGMGRTVAVEGGAGMGKTRLLREARVAAEQLGFRVLAARGGELEHEFGFGVVRQVFEPVMAALTGEERAEVVAGAARLAVPLFEDAPVIASREAGDTSFAMLHGLYWLAANFALRRPTVIVVDDLHWADAPSLRWIAYLSRRLDGLPLLLAIATRPPEHSPESALLVEVLTDAGTVVLRPGPLGTEAVWALVSQLLGADPAPDFVAACKQATGGNPLFLHALLDALRRRDVTPSAGNVTRVLTTGPEDVSRAVSLRLNRLPAEATAFIRAAAVLGDGQPLRHVAPLADLDPDGAWQAATTLARSGLLRTEDPVEFVHPIIRTAVLAAMGLAERSRAHRRAGQLLAEAAAPMEQAAAHLVQSQPGDDPAVRATLLLAAEHSLARGAPQPAVGYLRRVLDESPPKAERGEILHALGIAELRAGVPGAAVHLGEALALVDDPRRRAEIAVGYAVALTLAHSAKTAMDVLQRVADDLDDPQLRLRLQALWIDLATFDAATNDAAVARMAALDEATLGHGPGPGVLRAVMAFHEARLGISRPRCIALATRSLEEGLLTRPAAGLEGLEGLQAIFALICAEAPRVGDLIDDALTEARRRGDVLTAAHLLFYRGMVGLHRGELLDAEEDLQSAEVDLGASASLELFRVAYLAMVLVERDKIDAAESVLNGVRLEKQPSTSFRVPRRYARAKVDAEMGRTEAALAGYLATGELLESVDFGSPAFLPWRSEAALALRSLGRHAEALTLAHQEVELARRWEAARPVGIALHALGLVEDAPAGEHTLREAVEVLEGSPARLEHARTLLDLAALLRRTNRRREAHDLLRRGLEIAYRAGGTRLVRQFHDELAALGARPRRLVLTGVDALTGSERRVARLAATGMANKEIAQALYVTVKAVEVHLTSTYRKLSISSRAQLASALSGSPPGRIVTH